MDKILGMDVAVTKNLPENVVVLLVSVSPPSTGIKNGETLTFTYTIIDEKPKKVFIFR